MSTRYMIEQYCVGCNESKASSGKWSSYEYIRKAKGIHWTMINLATIFIAMKIAQPLQSENKIHEILCGFFQIGQMRQMQACKIINNAVCLFP